MKKITISLLAVIVFIASCSRHQVAGDGNIKTESRQVSDFSALESSGAYQIKWSPGAPMLTISADENLLPLIKTSGGGTLKIDAQENLTPSTAIIVTLSSAQLSDAKFTGGIRFVANGISGKNLKLECTGASDITVNGSVTNLDANLTGASRLNATALHAQNADLTLLGASQAGVFVTDKLKVKLTGAASLMYSGNPKTVDKDVTGAGRIQAVP
jgi:hypothetical protein